MTPDELARKEEQHRAQQAQALLDHPLLQDALSRLRDGLLAEIEKAAVGEVDKVRDAQRCLKLLRKLEEAIRRHIVKGDMATAQILEWDEQRRRSLNPFKR